jgi:hypothetical protein
MEKNDGNAPGNDVSVREGNAEHSLGVSSQDRAPLKRLGRNADAWREADNEQSQYRLPSKLGL